MKFSVDPKIFERFSGVEIGVLVITEMNNQGKSEELLKLLRNEEKIQKSKLQNVGLGSLPEISGWRKIYKDFGSNPSDFRSSIEALLRRARGGEKPIPQINNLVDLYNFISLKYHLPAGSEDLDKTEGDISLTFAKGDEKGIYIGGDIEENCEPGEVIYKDDAGFICRRWNWREADRTKLDRKTRQAVLVIEKLPEVSSELFDQAVNESEELVRKILSGQVNSKILNLKDNEFSFEIKQDLNRKIKGEFTSIQKPKQNKKGNQQKTEKPPNPIREILEKNPPFLNAFLKELILKAVAATFPAAKLDQNAVKIENPKVINYGDYSTNLALILAGQLKLKPMDIAEKLIRKIEEYIKSGQLISIKSDSKDVNRREEKINTILENVKNESPGFINFYLAKNWLINQFDRLLKTDRIDKTVKSQILALKNKKIILEFTDPNPFKDFHIGHLYSNSVGESYSRLFEFLGAEVKRVNYQGDVGMHVAKAIWGIKRSLEKASIKIGDIEKRSLKERIEFLGNAYSVGATAYEENDSAKEKMKDINYLVFMTAQNYLRENHNFTPIVDYQKYVQINDRLFEEISDLYRKGREWSLEYFERIYNQLGTKFDNYFFESEVGEYGVKLVLDSLKNGVFEESDGAVVFPGKKYGLHTRVFINKLGLPTYEAKELGLAPTKYKFFKYDISFIITAKEIDEYFKVLLTALSLINKNLADKTFHIGHGLVKLPSGKMSSRTGDVVTGESLIKELKKRIIQKLESNEANYSAEEIESISHRGAVAAIKYSFLKVALPADLIFDIDKSVSFEGDSGPYLLYTYARAKSVLRKSALQGQPLQIGVGNINSEEMNLLRAIGRFEEVVWEASKNLAPSLICTYLYDLATKFNLFYQKHSILGKSDQKEIISDEKKGFRLGLTEATALILKRGLNLLGIETVERM